VSRLNLPPRTSSRIAANAMVAAGQPLAVWAGLRALERGGNAADAALAAATTLCVTEPMCTGIGGDLFAIVWDGEELHGLDASGPAPRSADPRDAVAESGPASVTVPGALRGWEALADRFGRRPFEAAFGDAIDLAARGYAVQPMTAQLWSEGEPPAGFRPAPRLGEVVRLPELGRTLARIASEGPDVLYTGALAERICALTSLAETDLRDYEARWVEPMSTSFRGIRVAELPPPTQGVVALEALALLERLPAIAVPDLVKAVQLSLEDGLAHVRDGVDVGFLLEREYLARRWSGAARPLMEPAGGTVYVCAVDQDRMAVSLIQSLYHAFGSRVAVDDAGVVLQNRGAGFLVEGAVTPGRRPFHTIIPGMLMDDDGLVGPFGCVGGFMQAQGHAQIVVNLFDGDGQDPQAALDAPRFRIEGKQVLLEDGLEADPDDLAALGLEPVWTPEGRPFGGAQIILARDDVLVGASDRRRDGAAAGF
jgi:gamma-glutamyltranspeptidase/glutathione hydrolase